MKRLHDYYGAFFRFGVGGDALVSWYNSFSDPTARMFKIAQHTDGGTLIWMMGVIGCILMLDVLLNDCTPDQIVFRGKIVPFRWKRVFVFRHFVIIALAATYAFHPFVAERSGYAVSSPLYFYWNAFLITGLAFFDAKERTRSHRWQRAYS